MEGLKPYKTTYSRVQRHQNKDTHMHVTCSFIRRLFFFNFNLATLIQTKIKQQIIMSQDQCLCVGAQQWKQQHASQ
jgi:hypothetical protein